MATIRFKERKNKTGNTIEMIVSHGRGQRARIASKIETDLNGWDEKLQRFKIETGLRKKPKIDLNEKRKLDNAIIEAMEIQAKTIINKLSESKHGWTLNQFKAKYKAKPKQYNISAYFEKHIKILIETNHIGNAKCYSATHNILKQFDKDFEKKVFNEIDYNYIKRFEIWLEKRGCKGNTRKYYHKALRALMNKAIKEKECNRELYPYGKDGFNISKLSETTEKRYLTTTNLDKLKKTVSKSDANEFARLTFLFMYYTYGMSFIDMALLKQSNVIAKETGKYISYKRQKVKNNKDATKIDVKLTPTIVELINKLKEFQQPIDDYLVPIVSRKKESELELYEHITSRRNRIGKNLKSLAKEFELDTNLTTYVSRHTMAMQLQNNNIPETIISQILNHSDLKTTKIYLSKLDNSVIDEATEVL